MMNSAGPCAHRFLRSGKQRKSLNRRKRWRYWGMVLPSIELSGGDRAKECLQDCCSNLQLDAKEPAGIRRRNRRHLVQG